MGRRRRVACVDRRHVSSHDEARQHRSRLESGCNSGVRTLAQARTIYRRCVSEPTFTTPEEAALTDFPPKYARVESVSYSLDGSRATVTLLTNEEPYLYRYYVNCERNESGRWIETDSHN